MAPVNDFVLDELPIMQEYIESAGLLSFGLELGVRPPVPKAVVERSLDTIYKQLLMQRAKLTVSHPRLHAMLVPLVRAIGIPDTLRRALAAQGQSDHAIKTDPK